MPGVARKQKEMIFEKNSIQKIIMITVKIIIVTMKKIISKLGLLPVKKKFINYNLLFPEYQVQEVAQFHHTSCNHQILIN